MGDIVNLRQVKKAKVRANAERCAAQNRIDFGLSKQQKSQAQAVKQAQDIKLDAHQRQRPDTEPLR
jgi:Domain of unknown function (DUF4169)